MLSNYIKTYINQMARRTGTTLTNLHMRVLEFAYNYYEKNKVGPLYKNIKRYTGVTQKEIEQMFPNRLNSVYTWVDIPIQSTNKLCKPVAKVHVENRREVYLDYNGTTNVRKEVRTIIEKYASGKMGHDDPSSSHWRYC